MKKRNIVLLIDAFFYNIFTVLYSSKGLAYILAEETTKPHKVNTKQGTIYSYLYFNPISKTLYRVGALGIVLTGIVLVILLTHITYREIKYLWFINLDDAHRDNFDKKEKKIIKTSIKNNFKKYGTIILITIIYSIIVFYIIPTFYAINFFSEVGKEHVYLELF